MQCSKNKSKYVWEYKAAPKGYGSVLRVHPRNKPGGFFVSYKDGETKFSKKPLLEKPANDYGTLLRAGKQKSPASDHLVLDTRSLIH